MRPMQILVVVMALAGAWSAHWAWVASTTRGAMTAWRDTRVAEGWQVDWTALRLQGFPNRLDRTLEGLSLADPAAGWAWQAPFLQILGLSYRFDHLILAWPDSSLLATPAQRMTIAADQARSSLTFSDATGQGTLIDAVFVAAEIGLASDQGWTASARDLRLASRPTPGRGALRDVALAAQAVRLPLAGGRQITLDRVAADLAVDFDGIWQRDALHQRRPRPRSIELRELAADLDGMHLRAAGRLELDADGRPEGRLTLRATRWQEMLDLAAADQALPPAVRDMLASLLGALAGAAGDPETLELPLSFRDGQIWLGEGLLRLPLGPAPVLTLP